MKQQIVVICTIKINFILWEKIPLIFPIYFSPFDQWDFFFEMGEYPIIDGLGHRIQTLYSMSLILVFS
jgi:hypothetical protein